MSDDTLHRNMGALLRARTPAAEPGADFLARLDRLAARPDRTGFLPLALIAAVVLAALVTWALRTAPAATDGPAQDATLPEGAVMRIAPPEPQGARVTSVATSADGRLVAVGTETGAVRVHELATGAEKWRHAWDQEYVGTLLFVGSALAGGGGDGSLRVIDWDSRKSLFVGETRPDGTPVGPAVVLVGPGLAENEVLVVNENGAAYFLDAASGGPGRRVAPGAGANRFVAAAGGKRLFLAGSTLRTIDLDSGAVISETESEKRAFRTIAAAPDGSFAVTGGNDVRLWRTIDLAAAWRVAVECTSLAVSPDEALVAVAGHEQVVLLESATGHEVHRLPGRASIVAFTPDGRLLTGAGDGGVTLWHLRPSAAAGSQEELWERLAGAAAYAAVHGLAAAGDAAFIVDRLRPPHRAAEPPVRLIADLEGDDLATREAAERELRKGEDDTALLERLAQNPPADTKARIESILARTKPPPYQGASLQRVRAVQALALMKTDASRRALDALAKESPFAAVRTRARAAVR